MRIYGLTERQLEVARLVGQCVPVKEIAKRLHVSVFTIHDHIDRIAVAWNLDPTLDVRSQIVKRIAAESAA